MAHYYVVVTKWSLSSGVVCSNLISVIKVERFSNSGNCFCRGPVIFFNLIVFKALKGDAHNYIQSLFSINELARPLCLGDKMYKLKEPRWKLKSKGYRSFHVAAPRYRNSLPDVSATSNWI